MFLSSFGLHAQVMKIGEEVNISFETLHPYFAESNTSGQSLWETELEFEKGAGYIALHFESFEIEDGHKLILSSPITDQSWEYDSESNTRGSFWSVPIYGNQLHLSLIGSTNSDKYGITVDKVARGYTDEELQKRSESTRKSICGTDDSEEAKCYENSEPVVYENSRAVARLILNGTGLCTGFLVGSEGHLMTNDHCLINNNTANNLTVEMMAEGADCATDCTSPLACPGDIVANTTTLIQNNAALDYALLLVPNNPSTTYGFLQLRNDGATIDERIYIPQHPRAWGKRIALESDNNNDMNGYVSVQDLSSSGCFYDPAVSYFGDTRSGSSGSPVISYEDHLVIAIHGCGGCPNSGVNMSGIIQDLNYIPHDALPTHECGQGQDMVISSSQTISTDMEVPGDIFVTNGAQLTINSNLSFGEDRGIYVEKGSQLFALGATLTSCEDEWRGITVNGQGNTDFDVWLESTVIRNARTGVQCYPNGIPWPEHFNNDNAIVWAKGSTRFEDCNRGIAFISHVPQNNESEIENCFFENCGEGISNWNCQNVLINNNEFIDINTHCILTIDGSFNMALNEFDSDINDVVFLQTINSSSSWVYNNDFTGPIGIRNEGATMDRKNFINNRFDNQNIGIDINGDCIFNALNNEFNPSSVGSSFGISADAGGNLFNLVKQNKFMQNQTGMQCLNANDGMEIESNCFNTQVSDIYIDGTLHDDQGNPVIEAGNCFSGHGKDLLQISGNAFEYYWYPVEEPNQCKKPKSNIGVWTLGLADLPDDGFLRCGNNLDQGPPEQPSIDDLLAMRADVQVEINQLELSGEDGQSSAFLKDLYNNEASINRSLVEAYIMAGDFQEARQLLDPSSTSDDVVLLFSSYIFENSLNAAQNMLDALEPSSAQTQDWKWVQQLNLKRLAAENYVATTEEINQLKTLGEKRNPYAAYARSLYYVFTGEFIDLPYEMQQAEPRSTGLKERFEIDFYPNPVMGQLTVELIGDNIEDVRLRILDITGRTVKTLNDLKTVNKISTVDLKEGFYYIELSENASVISQDKLVVLK